MDTKLEWFLDKNQHTQRELVNFVTWNCGELSKIGHHFRKKSDLKIDLSKNVNNKKCAPKFVLFDEKKSKRFQGFFR